MWASHSLGGLVGLRAGDCPVARPPPPPAEAGVDPGRFPTEAANSYSWRTSPVPNPPSPPVGANRPFAVDLPADISLGDSSMPPPLLLRRLSLPLPLPLPSPSPLPPAMMFLPPPLLPRLPSLSGAASAEEGSAAGDGCNNGAIRDSASSCLAVATSPESIADRMRWRRSSSGALSRSDKEEVGRKPSAAASKAARVSAYP
mmetsp:Transcript_9745/g.29329  ORF Transcript_9745/g.29329 Transcript_9745/m.29329 type:complete len:201 (+) Transcript_9745:719-1321(+)